MQNGDMTVIVPRPAPAAPTPRAFLPFPRSLDEALTFVKTIVGASLVPKEYRGSPGDVLLAIQMGVEVGFSPGQALQSISIINGRATIYGDAAIALVLNCGHLANIREWYEGEGDGLTAGCEVTRGGMDPHTRTFSVAMAKRAKLWGKAGPWTDYPARMLQMRARAFALRDRFADVLRGLQIREEVEDYVVDADQMRDPVKPKAATRGIETQLAAQAKVPPPTEEIPDVAAPPASDPHAPAHEPLL